MNLEHETPAGRSPWPLVFSFGRALQQPALQIWRGQEANVLAAQRALIHRANCNGAAVRGLYKPSMEHKPALRLAS
jgi:fructose-bisphosphate aldolase class I